MRKKKKKQLFRAGEMIYRVSIKSFPDYKHLLHRNYVEYKHIFFSSKVTQLKKFFRTNLSNGKKYDFFFDRAS
jgi:hypothetical protein